MSERINARLSQPLAEFVDRMVGEAGLYETPSEYVRDLIRRDMERRDGQFVQDAILTGFSRHRSRPRLCVQRRLQDRHGGAGPQGSRWLAMMCHRPLRSC